MYSSPSHTPIVIMTCESERKLLYILIFEEKRHVLYVHTLGFSASLQNYCNLKGQREKRERGPLTVKRAWPLSKTTRLNNQLLCLSGWQCGRGRRSRSFWSWSLLLLLPLERLRARLLMLMVSLLSYVVFFPNFPLLYHFHHFGAGLFFFLFSGTVNFRCCCCIWRVSVKWVLARVDTETHAGNSEWTTR